MKKYYLILLISAIFGIQSISAASDIALKFTRSGTDAQSVAVSVTDEEGNTIDGASAAITASHNLKGTENSITEQIVCPDINANTSPTIELTFTINGIPEGFSFNTIGMDIHALNSAGNYQTNNDNKTRYFNIKAEQGSNAETLTELGQLSDIDIAAGVGSSGAVHKIWQITNRDTINSESNLVIKLTITKGSENSGCFFGLSEVILSNVAAEPEPEPTPTPTPEPDTTEGKVYKISWKNTGGNFMTEGDDNSIFIDSYDVTKRMFWQLIPTEKENCYYIKNTATGNYIGSCNKTPSSASRISTTGTPVEYYIAPTAATSGEISGCHYFSSTDCSNYSSESDGPRALNKDGASNYVITWQAGTSRVGSYWKLIETEDLYEIRPFNASTAIGKISTIYMLENHSGKNISLSSTGLTTCEADQFDNNQLWYFVGTNNKDGWQIASVAQPSTVIGISDNTITAGEALSTTWKVHESKTEKDYYYFTAVDSGNTLIIDNDSLFRFKKQRSSYARNNQIYNNPCGIIGNNYISRLTITGEDVLNTLLFTSTQKPSKWHIIHTAQKSEVTKGGKFNIDATLSTTPANDLEVHAYFDWNCDGIFETAQQLTLSGNKCSAEVSVPEWAIEKQARMRIRVNNSGLNLPEDDVIGFVYDYTIKASSAQEGRTVTLCTNAEGRGSVELSETADSYTYGTTLTATATANGNSRFICWREGDLIVSTTANYTFTVDHNVTLTAYFSPDPDGNDSLTDVIEINDESSIAIQQSGNRIEIISPYKVCDVTIYTPNASVAARNNNNAINISHLSEGIYIIRVETEKGYKNLKFHLNK